MTETGAAKRKTKAKVQHGGSFKFQEADLNGIEMHPQFFLQVYNISILCIKNALQDEALHQ